MYDGTFLVLKLVHRSIKYLVRYMDARSGLGGDFEDRALGGQVWGKEVFQWDI